MNLIRKTVQIEANLIILGFELTFLDFGIDNYNI